mmetsp:Transcript_9271/g.20115  ORF Transcript_9271/g.20115 Transcript_9271/m.20115 type:complete len:233 (-) Transcript_9271:193-891(-)
MGGGGGLDGGGGGEGVGSGGVKCAYSVAVQGWRRVLHGSPCDCAEPLPAGVLVGDVGGLVYVLQPHNCHQLAGVLGVGVEQHRQDPAVVVAERGRCRVFRLRPPGQHSVALRPLDTALHVVPVPVRPTPPRPSPRVAAGGTLGPRGLLRADALALPVRLRTEHRAQGPGRCHVSPRWHHRRRPLRQRSQLRHPLARADAARVRIGGGVRHTQGLGSRSLDHTALAVQRSHQV